MKIDFFSNWNFFNFYFSGYFAKNPHSSVFLPTATYHFQPKFVNASGSPTPYRCEKCGKQYSLKNNLYRHVKFECDGERRFWCHLCPNKYTQNASLHRHLISYHNVDAKELQKRKYNRHWKTYIRFHNED